MIEFTSRYFIIAWILSVIWLAGDYVNFSPMLNTRNKVKKNEVKNEKGKSALQLALAVKLQMEYNSTNEIDIFVSNFFSSVFTLFYFFNGRQFV